MGYKVLRKFADLQDNRHVYMAGDEYPRSGMAVDDSRIAELAGTHNKVGQPLIEEYVAEVDTPKTRKTAEKSRKR